MDKIVAHLLLGARLRGRTATQRSKKGSEKGSEEGVLRRVLRRGLSMGFTVKKGSEKGSQKGFSEGSFQKVPRTPLEEYAPLGVRPILTFCHNPFGSIFWAVQ